MEDRLKCLIEIILMNIPLMQPTKKINDIKDKNAANKFFIATAIN